MDIELNAGYILSLSKIQIYINIVIKIEILNENYIATTNNEKRKRQGCFVQLDVYAYYFCY